MNICLIGSTKFKNLYQRVNSELTKVGHVVYTVAFYGNSGDEMTDDDKIVLDLVHLEKIRRSDLVVVVTDDTKYVGFSTNRELIWSKMHGKAIIFVDGVVYNGLLTEDSPRHAPL